MQLTRVAILRPVFICMIVGALIVLGLRARSEMKTELNPKVDFPLVTVTTTYVGAGPEEIETLVSKPIEDAVSSVNHVKTVTSTSQENISVVSIEFYMGTNLDVAVNDVRDKVDAARRQLPDDADPPVISKLDIASAPIMMIGLTANRPMVQLKKIADDTIKDAFGKVPGVAAVTITGGETREIRVRLDRDRLAAYGLTVQDVASAIRSQNINVPGGVIDEGDNELATRSLGEFTSVDQLRNLRMQFSRNGNAGPVIRLGDIGTVEDSIARRTEITRVQGKPSVGILIQKSSDANTVDVANGIKAEMKRLQQDLPRDFKFVISQDDSTHVRDALQDVNFSLIFGIVLVVLTVFLFLHNIRGTFIVAIAIPTSLIATFLPMYAFGFTLNQMTMLGLSLVIGILVDDSIVVLENIYRHLAMGEGPRDAAFNGRTEIGLAAVAITMTDVVVFVPIAFMGGIVGQFFRQFGITVAIATLFSLFISFTLTPMLASRWFRRGEETEAKTGVFGAFNRFYGALDEYYRRLLRVVMHSVWSRLATVVIGFMALVLTVVLAMPHLGFQFVPDTDQGQVGITVELPAGTALPATDRVMRRLEKLIRTIPEVTDVFTNVGRISGGFLLGGQQMGGQYGQITAQLEKKANLADRIMPWNWGKKLQRRTRSDKEIAAWLRKRMPVIPGAIMRVVTVTGFGGTQAPVQIELQGNDYTKLVQVAERIRDRLRGVPGILSPDISFRIGKPEVQVHIDRDKAASFGFSVSQVGIALRDAVEGNTDAKYRDAGDEYNIRVQLRKLDRSSVADVGRIIIGTRDNIPVQLSQVADLSFARGPTKIDRKNRQRLVTVEAYLAAGHPLGNMQITINKAIADIPLEGASLHWGGEAEQSAESNQYLGSALLLSVILVYMLMAALFESMITPLVIMFSLPMALVGGLLALVLTHNTLSIVAMIGVIMLMGLVTKNAILLIDYTNTLRARGMAREEAVLEASPTRLRPILMTTTAMVFGMLPIAFKLGESSEMRAPLAIIVIGGLIVSTMLTLLVIPSLYSLMDSFVSCLGRIGRRLRRPAVREGAQR